MPNKNICRTIKAHLLSVIPLLMLSVFLGGCASNMTSHYAKIKTKMDAEDYEGAAKLINKSKGKYGKKNVLLFYMDSGMINQLAQEYKTSAKYFEDAKKTFDDYYQKSVTAGAASMFLNDNTMPYYGENFERAHINVFEALDYAVNGQDNEAVVEARQVNTLFRTFAYEKNYKNYYKDDGFIRYFMGLIYENGGYLNDAHISYYLALKAYKEGLASIAPPQNLIDDAYTSAKQLGMYDRADEIKKNFPSAKMAEIPEGCGELIIVNYNGHIPQKIDNILEFALFNIWPYINQVEVTNQEQADFEQARSITISAFANDYVKVAFPKYKRIPNRVYSFTLAAEDGNTVKAYKAQDLAEIAEKCLKDNIGKIYAKTLARAAVKYAIGKSVSKAVDDNTNNSGWGTLTQIGFNVFNSATATADKRGWNTLPENILMARVYLPEGENLITLNYLGQYGEKIISKDITVEIKKGKKTFAILRSAM